MNTNIPVITNCRCGMAHGESVEFIYEGRGVLPDIAEFVGGRHFKNVFLVFDSNTVRIEGVYDVLAGILRGCGVNVSVYIFEDSALVPDEAAVGKMVIAVPEITDLIIGIGSGVINDLCRICSFKLRIDYTIIATAASMDGYLSNVSPLIVGGVKTTFAAKCPIAAICDYDILNTAPPLMTAAGVGDILGKAVCTIDWKLSNLLFGEEYCAGIAEMVTDSVKICIDAIEGLTEDEKLDAEPVMKALIKSGMAMSFMGNSRPASGGEHHISHYWEMQFLTEGKPPVLHGIKVAVATLAVIRLYGKLLLKKPDFDKCRKVYSEEYLEAYERIDCYERKWDAVREMIMSNLPDAAYFELLLKKAGCPTTPQEIGISHEQFFNGLIHAKEIRPRFTVLRLADDLSVLTGYAGEITHEYYGGK